MLSEYLEGSLSSISANSITELFLWLLISFFVFALVLKNSNRGHGFTQYTPTLLTTLGILGTFVGIVSGLLGFDVNNIDQSISTLLAGLKTAFITSLAGMSASIGFKLLISTGLFSPKLDQGIDGDSIGISELYSVMREQVQSLEVLRQTVGGDGETSLVGQIKLMRSDLGDNQKRLFQTIEPIPQILQKIGEQTGQQQHQFEQFQERLWIKLQDFADLMSKSATEQVIEALKTVIADFNQNLTEQFGENFKQLNEAVLSLVQWQENYKEQLLQMSQQYQQGVEAIGQTESAVSRIGEASKAIPDHMQQLKSILEVNQHQLQELERHLESFKEIRDKAVEALPEIRKHIDETVDGVMQTSEILVTGLSKATDQVTKEISTSIQDMSTRITESTNETQGALRTLAGDMKEENHQLSESYKTASQTVIHQSDEMRNRFEKAMSASHDQMTQSLKEQTDKHAQENQRVLEGMSRHAQEALQNTGETVEKQVKMIEDSMERELNRVLSELGKALTQISGGFTQDYKQLVQEMQRVTRTGVN
jgi:hypothetical protein